MATCTAILLLGEEDRYRSGIRPTEQLFYHESNPPFWTCRRFALGRMRDRRRERIPLRPHHVPPTPASPHLVTDALLRFLPHHSDAFERVEAHLEAIEEIMDRSISSCFRDMSAILSVAVARQHLDRARWALERAPFARKVVATLLWGAPDDAIVQNLERIHCVYEVCRAARAPARRRGP